MNLLILMVIILLITASVLSTMALIAACVVAGRYDKGAESKRPGDSPGLLIELKTPIVDW
jgi:hypothetical protein